MVKNFSNNSPNISESVYISETSVIIGDVVIKENSNIWFGAVLRGDEQSISIGRETNIQENVVIHGDGDNNVTVGNGVTIGHGAIIHGCAIGDNVLIGMGAIILNGAKISKNSIVAAGSLITQNKEFEDGSLILGNPAKVIRKLTQEEIQANKESSLTYVNLAKKMADSN
ncbi:gamma carbonic anhydrase family protein [Clostridium botulinum]|uniref:Ferripyochelin binding protein n=1 Tax=Clostridium botulinum (strain Eklund 17B / Type B) TaxID=935198 RepID=B2TNC9_CLOBB|nr:MULTISPECIES: gamma carbonic anhydrase family protein [Clostridium]ACD24950.1 ferripyochelin binding protein [Clostridium botulinum B str. Eklund 17B (NRP)]MBY6976062.1 gamma carbonic anhydrase family protein [Clostridium botulinum]MBY7000484.1 gamma carbonic anhydrase family protein [Clostridium botulinum]MCR1273246.1 gamma carbonic anhydrase family protein [Clostridium botulinum]NFD70344.1 gamma carbonic anhydrase family protein [Clostridium botulinum]